MKRIILIFTLLLPALLYADNFKVLSFKALTNDMAARVLEPVYDRNGDKCAILKFVTTENDFIFTGDAHGIMDITQKVGEIWVYVPQKSRKITINHNELGELDYVFPEIIQTATVYEIRLSGGELDLNIEAEKTRLVVIESDPLGAIVFIDNIEVGKTPYTAPISYGDHVIKVNNIDLSEEKTITVSEESKYYFNFHVNPNRGTFTDTRDKKNYKWVRIEDNIWMAENLAFSDVQNTKPISGNGFITEKLGNYYTFQQAQTVCPDNWHLPTVAEWEQIIASAITNSIIGNDGWLLNSENIQKSEFSALPVGYIEKNKKEKGKGYYATFWTSELNKNKAKRFMVNYEDIMGIYDSSPNNGLPVRCVKDK